VLSNLLFDEVGWSFGFESQKGLDGNFASGWEGRYLSL
jgi:hypothetical protein